MNAYRSSLAAGLVVIIVGLAFILSWVGLGVGDRGHSLILVGTSAWFVVGALIVALRPGNAVGWVFSAVGLLWTSGLSLSAYLEWTSRATGTAITLASWYSEWFWIAALLLTIVAMYLFPTGHVPSRAWRRVLTVVCVGGLAGIVYAAFQPTLQATKDAPTVVNPIGISSLNDIADSPTGPIFSAFMLAAAIAGITSIVMRYRRSGGVERRQIKWVAVGVPFAVLGWVVAGILDSAGIRSDIFWVVPMAAIPLAAGVAILRYRLFDVDRLISRTLVYGALTVILGIAYVGLVLAGQALFSSFAGGSNLAIAVSTLVVAALFLPARSRVQKVVDRRFYRSRYDAQRTLETFGARLRQQVELEALTTDLRGVVGETMQPGHIAVWLRREAGR